MRNRLAIVIMAAVLTVVGTTPAWAKTPTPSGRAAVLIDGATGQILFGQNPSTQAYPASTTKLLTALVAVEHGKLDQMISVSRKAIDQEPDSSSCYLNAGEQQSLENLLYGLLLASGNDCAVAIAEGVSGGKTEQFVDWMNQTAQRIGATHSHFANPHGLHDPNHYTTALDLALIARAAFANPTLLKIAGTKEFDWPGKAMNGTYYNHNSMLFTYDGVVAGKTGYTEQAGLTLVDAAKRGDRYLIGVVMGEANKLNQYNDMGALLDHGFADFEQKVAVKAGTVLGSVTVSGGKAKSVPVIAPADVSVMAPKGSAPALVPRLDDAAKAPIQPGQKLGAVDVKIGDQLIGTVEADAQASVAAVTPWRTLILGWALAALKWTVGILLGLLLLRTVVKTARRLLRRRRPGARSGSGQRAGYGVASGRNSGEVALDRMRQR